MSFLYADTSIGKLGEEKGVRIVDQPPQDWVSVAVRGTYTGERFDEACEKLRGWLAKEAEWEAVGEPRLLGFNSPFVPSFLRYSEVQIPVKPVR